MTAEVKASAKNSYPKHDEIRDAFARELHKYDNHRVFTELWVFPDGSEGWPDGEKGRADVWSYRTQWCGLSKRELSYAYEIKQNTGSLSDLGRQVDLYERAGMVPVPVVPLPSAHYYDELVHDYTVKQFEQDAERGVVYYDRDLNWSVLRPAQAGLTHTNIPETKPVYSP